VRSQIQGQLVQIAFSEGRIVHKGDLLALIDPRPYQAQLDQAVANRDRDQALLADAEVGQLAGATPRDGIALPKLRHFRHWRRSRQRREEGKDSLDRKSSNEGPTSTRPVSDMAQQRDKRED
jgi:multidrug efflux pump subunit AcrA (membrane-fusion protein)